nr:MAG TPA: hypothetical protein [Caudoviricetes sp.]
MYYIVWLELFVHKLEVDCHTLYQIEPGGKENYMKMARS